jgi:hypothetical protein
MKIKKIANLMLIMACISVQQSCSLFDPNTTDSKFQRTSLNRLILGKWYQDQFIHPGEAPGATTEYEFSENGRFVYRSFDRNRTEYYGTWSISGARLIQNWENRSLAGISTESSIFEINKGYLELENIKKGRDRFNRKPKIGYLPNFE